MSELAAAQTRTQPTKQRAYKMLIGGRWQDAKSGATIESVDPSTEEVIATIPDGDEADVAEAVEAGKAAFAEWRTFSAAKRQKRMYELAARMEERVEHFALLR